MSNLTESAILQISKLQRDTGIQSLNQFFEWLEFCDERRNFHQEFVYDVAMFATTCGFSWTYVIRTAEFAKRIFPELDEIDLVKLLSQISDFIMEQIPNLTALQQQKFTQFMTESIIFRKKLFKAVIHRVTNMSTVKLDREVYLPPEPFPLAEGMDVQQWELRNRIKMKVASILQQKQMDLRKLQNGPRVTLGDIRVPQDSPLDTQGVTEIIRAAVQAAENQITASLTDEAMLVADILHLKTQRQILDSGGPLTVSLTNLGESGKPKSGNKGKAAQNKGKAKEKKAKKPA